MNSFYIALFNVFSVTGVFGMKMGNWLKKEPPTTTTTTTTTTEPEINYRAYTNILTTEGSTSEGPFHHYTDQIVLEKQKRKEEWQHEKERWNKHRQFTTACMLKKYVKIRDEFGCEMCTCIYEKSIMLCSPYQCPGKPMLYELGDTVYNDYVAHVQTNFREYNCNPGETLVPTPMCDCLCIAKDILSCPSTCKFGRELN